MSSALARQLQALGDGGVHAARELGAPKKRASILFDARQAATVDRETIFSLAESGLLELQKVDARFGEYQTNLFSPTEREKDRELATPEENEKINKLLKEFLGLLQGYFLLRPAHKCFEYLLRGYQVHELNIDDVLECVLPYHETPLFARVVQLIPLQRAQRWAFLQPVQKTGMPLTRSDLITRALSDFSILAFVSDMGLRAAGRGGAGCGRAGLSFSSTVLVEAVLKTKRLEKNLLEMVLPFAVEGANSELSPDLRSASYMLIGAISSRASLSKDLVSSLLRALAKALAMSDSALSDALRCMILLCQTQDVGSLPKKSVSCVAPIRSHN
eukprot:Rmarinus@m.12792